MRKFRIEHSRTVTYTPTAGLALVGHCINRYTSLAKTARSIPRRQGIPNIDLFRTYAGLLCIGKRDFEAAEAMRFDPFLSTVSVSRNRPLPCGFASASMRTPRRASR